MFYQKNDKKKKMYSFWDNGYVFYHTLDLNMSFEKKERIYFVDDGCVTIMNDI